MAYECILVTDLDGTLTNSKNQISPKSLATLEKLGGERVLRVIATGRNLFSARKILTTAVPIDFLIFSGGVGILDWKESKLLFSSQMNVDDTRRVTDYLKREHRDFMIQAPLPENHQFEYWQGSAENSDFKKRCELYSPYCKPWRAEDIPAASQIIIVEPQKTGAEVFEVIRRAFPSLSVVRTTSPLDGKSVWIEISAKGISKASSAAWLCEFFNIAPQASIGIGNDYNDSDLLQWVGWPFVVDNAPAELKEEYPLVASSDAEGFSEAAERALFLIRKP